MKQIETVLQENKRNIGMDGCVAVKINLFCHNVFISISKQIENKFLLNNTHFQKYQNSYV